MKKMVTRSEPLLMFGYLLRWLSLGSLVSMLAGLGSAVLLMTLDWATNTRTAHPWLLWFLPIAGFVVGLLYHYMGRSVEGGNNLLVDEVHDPKRVVPKRVAPLILLGTVVAHIFGESVGHEGTAVQIGGNFTNYPTRLFLLAPADRRILLMAGISAGFASVFSTPLADAVFGLGVLAIGSLRYNAILPCSVAAIMGDLVPPLLGVRHTPYTIPSVPYLTPIAVSLVVVAGIVFGLAGMTFAALTYRLNRLLKHHIAFGPLRPMLGGSVVMAAILALGTDKYLGLGISVIVDAFHTPLPAYDFAGKAVFTIVTLAFGFESGEATPLFYIGAMLSNVLGYVLPLPFSLLAGLGFVAMFTGAANTPIASTLMAMELFGLEVGTFVGVTCMVSYLLSGHTDIHHAQRIGHAKHSIEAALAGQIPAESAEHP